VKFFLDNLPPSLRDRKDALRKCLEAFDRVMPLEAVFLFGTPDRTAMLTCVR